MKTIVIISALQEEMDPLWADQIIFNLSTPHHNGDGIFYKEGYLDKHRIIAAAVCEMGLVASGIVTTKLILRWRPEIVIALGLCAGRPDMVQEDGKARTKKRPLGRGDIVVSTASFLYKAGFHQDGELQSTNLSCAAHRHVRNWVKSVKSTWQNEWQITPKPRRYASEPSPKIICGEYAAADYLMKNKKTMTKLSKKHSRFCALEMESYAVVRAAEVLKVPYGAVIAKAISDDGTSGKNDNKRDFVKLASKTFVLALARKFITATKRRNKKPQGLALPKLRKRILLLASKRETFERLSQKLKMRLVSSGHPKGSPPVYSPRKASLVLTRLPEWRCNQAEFAIWSTIFMTRYEPKLVLVVGACAGFKRKKKSAPAI